MGSLLRLVQLRWFVLGRDQLWGLLWCCEVGWAMPLAIQPQILLFGSWVFETSEASFVGSPNLFICLSPSVFFLAEKTCVSLCSIQSLQSGLNEWTNAMFYTILGLDYGWGGKRLISVFEQLMHPLFSQWPSILIKKRNSKLVTTVFDPVQGLEKQEQKGNW